MSKEQITLIENAKIISEDNDVAQSLNSFFSSIVTNVKILEYTCNNSNSENITSQNISADLGKILAHKISFCICLTNGNAQWIIGKYLHYCLQSYLTRLIAFPMNF